MQAPEESQPAYPIGSVGARRGDPVRRRAPALRTACSDAPGPALV